MLLFNYNSEEKVNFIQLKLECAKEKSWILRLWKNKTGVVFYLMSWYDGYKVVFEKFSQENNFLFLIHFYPENVVALYKLFTT